MATAAAAELAASLADCAAAASDCCAASLVARVTASSAMQHGNVDGMIVEIKRRERDLKQSRAKTLHAGEFNPDDWYGGGELDYRFPNARVLIRDIFESEGLLC